MEQFQQKNKSIHLEVLSEQGFFKITIGEKLSGREVALKQYFRKEISQNHIDNLTKKILSLLYRCTHSCGDKEGDSYLLRQLGQDLYDHIFPISIKESLTETSATNLILTIDDRLVSIPWELLHDGKEFLCIRFAMGRLVNTAQAVPKRQFRDLSKGIKVLILSNPKGDLIESQKEGLRLQEEMEELDDLLDVHFYSSSINVEMVRRMLRDCDFVHYAGHAEYYQDNPSLSGWLLKDGNLTAQDVMSMAGSSGNLPLLIFSNACKTGQTTKWELGESFSTTAPFDLVNAFLLAGVQHYIGAFCDISDEASLDIAINFYQSLMKSESIGESLKAARVKFINQYGPDNLTWASYMLYGDPTANYLNKIIDNGDEIDDKNNQNGNMQSPIFLEPTIARGSSSRGIGSSSGQSAHAKIKTDQPLKIIYKIGGFILICAIIISSLFAINIIGRGIINKKQPPITISKNDSNLKWEQDKWKVVNDIIKKLEERYSEQQQHNAISLKDSNLPIPICIVQDRFDNFNPKKDKALDILIEQFLEEESIYWIEEPNFSVVERKRLDFVLSELDRATSSISEKELNFILGHVLGAKGIIFIKILPFNSSDNSSDNSYRIYLRFVDTQTSAILAMAKSHTIIGQDIQTVARQLGAELIAMLKKNNEYKLLSR